MAFLGGPLHFLSELREAFIRTLKLDEEHALIPENSHLFAAIGSALNAKEATVTTLSDLKERLSKPIHLEFEVARMEPLFRTEEDYDLFLQRQSRNQVKTAPTWHVQGQLFSRH